jgi:hypothetical protein
MNNQAFLPVVKKKSLFYKIKNINIITSILNTNL